MIDTSGKSVSGTGTGASSASGGGPSAGESAGASPGKNGDGASNKPVSGTGASGETMMQVAKQGFVSADEVAFAEDGSGSGSGSGWELTGGCHGDWECCPKEYKEGTACDVGDRVSAYVASGTNRSVAGGGSAGHYSGAGSITSEMEGKHRGGGGGQSSGVVGPGTEGGEGGDANGDAAEEGCPEEYKEGTACNVGDKVSAFAGGGSAGHYSGAGSITSGMEGNIMAAPAAVVRVQASSARNRGRQGRGHQRRHGRWRCQW